MASVSLSKSVPTSFPHTYRFHLNPDLIRKFQDPTNPGIYIHHAYVPVTEFKREMFPDEVNPRSHEQLTGRVPKAIESSVAGSPADFHLLNRGVLVLAQSCAYDNQTKMLEVTISGPQDGGLADGATTDRVLSTMLDPATLKNQQMTEEEMLKCLSNAFVHVEVISGDFGSKLVSLAGARNTSNQVKEFALDNLDHKFDWLKDVIESSDLAGKVRYRENDPQPVDIRTVLAILTMFHPKWDEDQKEPVVAYSGKGGILAYFKDEDWLPGYVQLKEVVVEILELHEYIHGQFKNQYASFNRETKDSGAKFGKRREITYKAGKPQVLPFTDTEVSYVVPDGWLYPVVASMRMLLDFPNGKNARWVTSPFEYFDAYGYELVGDVVEQSAAYGFNPQTVGKSRPVWSGLRGKVKLKRIELAQEGKIGSSILEPPLIAESSTSGHITAPAVLTPPAPAKPVEVPSKALDVNTAFYQQLVTSKGAPQVGKPGTFFGNLQSAAMQPITLQALIAAMAEGNTFSTKKSVHFVATVRTRDALKRLGYLVAVDPHDGGGGSSAAL